MAIGVAIIGSGIFAKEEHLPAVRATPDLELKAIYSRSLKSAQSLAEGQSNLDLYSEDAGEGKGYADLLKRDDLKAVIIALPILAQPDYIKKALSAGKHVLAEKPVAKDVKTAEELIKFSKEVNTGATFAIAENFRFLGSFVYGAEQVKKLGRVLSFRARMTTLVSGGKYFETAWRKVPEYQGGFLLDGGVHFVAGIRYLLQPENGPVRVSAYTAQLQEHLPPVDTVNATWKLKNGASGVFAVSFGTTMSGSEYVVACEKGVVSVVRDTVTVTVDGKDEVKELPDASVGVKPEVKAWGESLVSGKPNPKQSPEEALKDLALIETMLRSGESDGAPIDLPHS